VHPTLQLAVFIGMTEDRSDAPKDRVKAGDCVAITGKDRTIVPLTPVNAAVLQSLTAEMPFSAESAADLVRSMRDDDRF
jgi:antitoxin (DNA-binding transcriptional repressor) of toxin-antitoxin stability system